MGNKFKEKFICFLFFLGFRTIKQQDTKLWNSFQDPPVEQTSGSSVTYKWLDASILGLKVFTYIFVLVVVLGTAVLAKSSLLMMTSLIEKDVEIQYCHDKRKNIFLKNISSV